MKSKIFFIIGLVLVIAGALLGYFADIPVLEMTGLAASSVGLALLIIGIVNKAEKKDWKLYTAIVGIVLGSFILALTGVAGDKITAIIEAVIGLVILVVSIIPIAFVKKKVANTVVKD